MADEKPHDGEMRSELVEKLNKEFDEHLKNVMEKNKDFAYDSGLTPENVEEVIGGSISLKNLGLKMA